MSAPAFHARVYRNWSDVPAFWHGVARDHAPTPFQTSAFLTAWYETLGARPGVTPLPVEILRGDEPLFLAPLVREREAGLDIISHADAGVSDNNAPLVNPDAALDDVMRAAAFNALRSVLPAADVLRLVKLPPLPGAQVLPGLRPSRLLAHPIELPDTFREYSRARSKKFRKEQERVWRVFQRHEGARFEAVTDTSEALRLFGQMAVIQERRMHQIGADYRLSEAAYDGFYRRLIELGLPGGAVSFTALLAGEELVGALFGVSTGRSVAFVRIAHASGVWRNTSPGRLVIEKTLEHLHAQGVRHVDLSIGDFAYKEDFGIGDAPMLEAQLALSLKGRLAVTASRFKRWLADSAPGAAARRALAGRARPHAPPAREVPSDGIAA